MGESAVTFVEKGTVTVMFVPVIVVVGKPGKVKLRMSVGFAIWMGMTAETLGSFAVLPAYRAVMECVPRARLVVVRLAWNEPFKA